MALKPSLTPILIASPATVPVEESIEPMPSRVRLLTICDRGWVLRLTALYLKQEGSEYEDREKTRTASVAIPVVCS